MILLLEDGSAIAWGWNGDGDGQCKIPDTQGRKFIQVSAKGGHKVAILEDGSCIAWGRNIQGLCNIPDVGGRKFMIPNSGGRTVKSARKC